MIVVALKGGHSNQLFQYATGRRLAHKHNTHVYMDKAWFSEVESTDTKRFYELVDYKIQQKFISRDKIVMATKNGDRTAKHSLYRLVKGRAKPTMHPYEERSLAFDRAVLNLPDDSYLEGYWQNENYFKDIRPVLLKELELKTKPHGKNDKWLTEIRGSRSVSLHIRRGDYAENKSTNEFHGLIAPAYYQKATELLAKKTGQKDFSLFIFSNDIDWCKQNLQFDHPTTFIDNNNPGAEDMRLMKHCEHNIMANSSFSWWGAWLNQTPEKIIIAPKVWFRDKAANSQIQLPKEWIRL
jgi:hypothetical protein